MRRLMNSYGKTWHTWHTGSQERPGMDLPYGEPTLMWSFNRDGECDRSLKEDRDHGMGLDSEANRRGRQPLLSEAHPQRGVDAMRADFPQATPIPGVTDSESG